MILACPSCSTRYLVADDAIGPTGRRVRCVRCRHEWSAPPPPPSIVRADPPPSAADDTATPARPAQLPAVPGPPRRSLAVWGWAGLALVVVALGAGLYFGRTALVHAWPASARLYEKLGLGGGAPQPVATLELRGVETRRAADTNALTVSGEIVNTGAEPQPLPSLRAALRAKDGRELHAWSFPPPAPSLAPGESVRFSSPVERMVEGASAVAVSLAPTPAVN